MKSKTKRLIAAVIVAPLIIGAMAGLFGFISIGWQGAILFFGAGAGIALVSGLIFGLPVHFILASRGLTGFKAYLLGAIAAAHVMAVANVTFARAAIPEFVLGQGLMSLVVFVPACLITAAIVWEIARPDLP